MRFRQFIRRNVPKETDADDKSNKTNDALDIELILSEYKAKPQDKIGL